MQSVSLEQLWAVVLMEWLRYFVTRGGYDSVESVGVLFFPFAVFLLLSHVDLSLVRSSVVGHLRL